MFDISIRVSESTLSFQFRLLYELLYQLATHNDFIKRIPKKTSNIQSSLFDITG